MILTNCDRCVLRISELGAGAEWADYYVEAAWANCRQAQSGISEARRRGFVERGAYALTDAGIAYACTLIERRAEWKVLRPVPA